jgi:hypothetical protein
MHEVTFAKCSSLSHAPGLCFPSVSRAIMYHVHVVPHTVTHRIQAGLGSSINHAHRPILS